MVTDRQNNLSGEPIRADKVDYVWLFN